MFRPHSRVFSHNMNQDMKGTDYVVLHQTDVLGKMEDA